MTDLHCHILPNIDDGAKDVSVSLACCWTRSMQDGVRNIAFTSHFNSERTTADAFLQKRAAAYETLTAALPTGPESRCSSASSWAVKSTSPPSSVSWMPRRSASAIPPICWWSFPLPTSPISSGRPVRPPAGAGRSAPHRPHRAIPLRPRRPHPALQLGGRRCLCRKSTPGALLDSPKLRRTLCKFISWGLVHVHLDGHPLPGQAPAPDGGGHPDAAEDSGH